MGNHAVRLHPVFEHFRRIFIQPVPLFSHFFIAMLLCVLSQAVLSLQHNHTDSINNQSEFHTLIDKIEATPYATLPFYKVSAKRFGPKKANEKNHLYQAAKRTLQSKTSWLESAAEPKLFNANGICFSGKWHIDQNSPFTGAFKQGTKANIIARASVALSGTQQKHKRALGLAVKIFDNQNMQSANLLTIHSLAGIKTQHVLNLALTNEPALKGLPALGQIRTLLRIDKDLKRADKSAGASKPKVNYRHVNHIAALNETVSVDNAKTLTAPTWVKLTPKTAQRIDADDFRDELRTEKYQNNKIEYKIEVAKGKVGKIKQAQWQTMGTLTLNKSIASLGCDINLHFAHPKRL